MVHHPRFGLVAEDPRRSLSKVWLGLVQRIHIVHDPSFGLVAEDPRGLSSKAWFGFRASM